MSVYTPDTKTVLRILAILFVLSLAMLFTGCGDVTPQGGDCIYDGGTCVPVAPVCPPNDPRWLPGSHTGNCVCPVGACTQVIDYVCKPGCVVFCLGTYGSVPCTPTNFVPWVDICGDDAGTN